MADPERALPKYHNAIPGKPVGSAWRRAAMRRLLLVLATFLSWTAAVSAQTVQDTQAPVPIGGSDTRALPSRSQLPPMFGASLFTGPGVTVQKGSTAPTSTLPAGATTMGTTAATASTQANPANSALAGLLQQGLSGASGAAGGLGLLSQVTGAASGGQPPTVPATPVQPPVGMAAFDPNHVMAPGDAVQVHIYGATTLDQQVTVDSNGDIFLPTIGPVHVAGALAGNLQSVVATAVATVYHTNAQVYVTLAMAVPVNVFVTGAVVAPGQYAQLSTASIITYLQAAGGIDPNRGSYRNIEVLRDGHAIAHVDLYTFLLQGHLPPLRMRERDTILVRPQGPTVAAEGDVSGVFRYELVRPDTGAELIELARPYPDATEANLVGIRDGRPASFSHSLAEFRSTRIQNGDVVTFTPDVPTNVMTVKLDGRIDGPTTLVVTREATLFDVLPYTPIDPYFSDASSIYVRRVSVAQAQTKAIQDSMQRLENTVVTSPTITAEQALMKDEEAKIIFQFASQLTNVQPEGRLVVQHDGHISNVRLEDGDVIVVPSRTDLVLVSGEVRVPQAVVWVSGANLDHYIKGAGGFTERADDDRILVTHPSGEVIVGSNPPILAGDRIIILPSPDSWALPFIKDLTQIMYQIAVGAGVALKL